MKAICPMPSSPHKTVVVLATLLLAITAGLSAHVVRGLASPDHATAFVSSPTAGSDAPIPIRWGAADTGLRTMCFYVANTSPARPYAPDWPRITGVGFELPGAPSGFVLLDPLDSGWGVVEGVRASLGGHEVTLDFAIVPEPVGKAHGRGHDALGLRPGQAAVRGSGTRFCVSGPFPNELTTGQPTTIEQLVNGVVVGFEGLEGPHRRGQDLGVWENPSRVIPLYQH